MLLAGVFGTTLSVVPQTPAVITAGIAAVLVAVAASKNLVRGRASLLPQPSAYTGLPLFSVLAVCYFVVRAWLSPVKDLGIEDLMLIMPAGIFYLSAGIVLSGKQAISVRLVLAWVVIFLLSLHVASGLMQLAGGKGFSVVFQFMGARPASEGSVIGMYGYYGSFANFAVIAGLLCISLGVWGRYALSVKGFILLLGLVSLFLSTLSQSRSAALSMMAGLLVLAILIVMSLAHQSPPIKKWALRVVGGMIALIVISSVVACYWVIQVRAGSNSGEGLNSLFDSVARLNFWPMAYDQWLDFPIFGAGARSFSYLCFEYWNPNLSTMHANPEYVHNEYLQLLADYGLIGLLLITVALVMHCYIGWDQTRKLARTLKGDSLRKGSNAMALTIAGVSGMIAMSVHVCFDFRTHLLANLLLLICCAVWLLPIRRLSPTPAGGEKISGARPHFQSYITLLCLFILGIAAIGIGGQQLWAGMPLFKQRMLKEDGAWKPYQVDRSVVIPMLEKSLSRTPRWQRSKRLGMLYKIEADEAKQPATKEKFYNMAEVACLASIKRNEHDPVPRINLAGIYTSQSRYSDADQVYAESSSMAEAREPWFKMHTQWALLRHHMAMISIEEGKSKVAEMHFHKAIDLFQHSRNMGVTMRSNKWKESYTECLLAYALFLDSEGRFEEAETLYSKLEKAGEDRYFLVAMCFYHYRGLHYYNHSLELWRRGEAEEAYLSMLKAKESMQVVRRCNKNMESELTDREIKQIQGFIQFFETTGIAK
ncbi:MAG: O-antigen ligase family protein [Akkermansiaceae bacterium]|nr:O-antigen ligase family protein [Akkermansiaceae bacterium]